MKAKIYYRTFAEMEIDIDERFKPLIESDDLDENETDQMLQWCEDYIQQIDPATYAIEIEAIHGIDFDGIWEC